MNRIFFAIALSLLFSAASQAQTAYRVDNFDFANGIRIETPRPAPQPKQRRSRKLTSLTSLKYAKSPLELTMTGVSETLGGFTTGNADVDQYIVDAGKRNSVDPLLLYAIMHQESTFKKHAVSPKGARGLMQLMPGTARRFGVTSIFDPKQNIEGGARYMRFLLDYFDGSVQLALAGYNAGEGAVVKYGYRVPPYAETQEYVRRIGRRYTLIRDPMAAQLANRVSPQQLAAVKQEKKPLDIYERTVSAVRLPDGRLQLLSQ
jgi:hypothetical protein